MMHSREKLQQVYIRIARDSGFALPFDSVAYLASRVLDCSPLEFWLSMDLKTMQMIADGNHPVCGVQTNG